MYKVYGTHWESLPQHSRSGNTTYTSWRDFTRVKSYVYGINNAAALHTAADSCDMPHMYVYISMRTYRSRHATHAHVHAAACKPLHAMACSCMASESYACESKDATASPRQPRWRTMSGCIQTNAPLSGANNRDACHTSHASSAAEHATFHSAD